MANFIDKYYTPLPSWAKGLTVVGVLAVGYLIWKNQQAPSPSGDQTKNDLNNAGDAVSNLAKQEIFPTLTNAEFTNISDAIVAAVSGLNVNINLPIFQGYFTTILNQFALLQNDADFYQLEKVFGLRDIGGFLGLGGYTATLSGVIGMSLSTSQIAELNNQLISQGLTAQF